jgi:hypothetical protein
MSIVTTNSRSLGKISYEEYKSQIKKMKNQIQKILLMI